MRPSLRCALVTGDLQRTHAAADVEDGQHRSEEYGSARGVEGAEGFPHRLRTHVLPDQDDGGWTVIPDPRGGVRVEYDLLYDPGGSVPGFVVRWFQGSGFVQLVGEMRTAAKP